MKFLVVVTPPSIYHDLLLVFSLFEYISSTKDKKQYIRGMIFHTGWEH